MRPSKSPSPADIAAERFAALTANYRPLPNIPDEFIDAEGSQRPHWVRFLTLSVALALPEIDSRFATADRHIRYAGVSYRAYGDTSERAWPLSHLPLLIEASEWKEIAAGISQRAELLEAVLSDIYGDGKLIAEGALPAAAITGSPDFLHPLSGIKPRGGKFLYFYAADLGRGPDGRWWVLGDRTQGPSGAGYALANRLVMSRAFPALYRDMNIRAARAVLPRVPARPDGDGDALRSAHLPADARPL